MSSESTIDLNLLLGEVDVTTRKRIANLAARGLPDTQIADILLLSTNHIEAVRTSREFFDQYHAEADRIIQEQIDRDEGWDGVETQALETLLQTMRFNRDPKFALLAGQIANRAERRSKQKKIQAPDVIDATKTGAGSNIVILNLNKTYINSAGEHKTIDMTPRPMQIPLKQSDIPSPKLVDDFLAPTKEKLAAKTESDVERMFREAGVVFDDYKDEVK